MWLDRQDFLYAFRSARRSPLLSIVAVAALSLGIGLNAGVFTLLNGIFLTPPTKRDPGSFVEVFPRYEGWFTGTDQYSTFTTEDYDALRTRSTLLKEIAAWQENSAVLEQGTRHTRALLVSCNYFSVFDNSRPLLGRLLIDDDCRRTNTAQPVLLDEVIWKQQFDANPGIVGETIHLNGLPFTVIGIVRPENTNVRPPAIYVPYTLQPVLDRHSASLLTAPDSPWLSIAARLQPGASVSKTRAELTGIMREQDRAYLQRKVSTLNRKTSVVLTNGSFVQNPAMHDAFAILLTLIMGPLSLVLLLACTNVTMLFLSRAMMRRGELAVRLALGAGRGRLLRMILLESLLTALVAGAASITLALSIPQLIMNAVDPGAFGDLQMAIDWHVFGFLAGLVAVAAVMSAVAPTQASWGLDLMSVLKGREGAVTTRSGLTSRLIVAQIAMSFVLLAAAVLFLRLPAKAIGTDPGFETRHLLHVPLDIDQEHHESAVNMQRSIASQVRAVPGVESLAYADLNPFSGVAPTEVRRAEQQKGQGSPATVEHVSDGFFSTFGIRMLRGRAFLSSDWSAASSGVAVVSGAFARQFWPGSDPVGKVVTTADDRHYRVVGVAADISSERFGVLDGPRLYLLLDPDSLDGLLFVRFTGNASTTEAAIRDAVRHLDPTMLTAPETIWESLMSVAENIRSLGRIVSVMASVAVLLAITGMYAVLSFAMQQRRREFGIRMVLGADRTSIFRSIMTRGGRQIAIGLMFGIALATPAAWLFARMTKRSPFPFQSFDITVYVIAGVLLMFVSLAAMYLPALRATQADPMVALRTE